MTISSAVSGTILPSSVQGTITLALDAGFGSDVEVDGRAPFPGVRLKVQINIRRRANRINS